MMCRKHLSTHHLLMAIIIGKFGTLAKSKIHNVTATRKFSKDKLRMQVETLNSLETEEINSQVFIHFFSALIRRIY